MADYDLASYATQMPDDVRAQVLSRMLRQRAQAQALAEATANAHSMDNVAVAGQISNNPAIAAAAKMMADQQVARGKPIQMGQTGFFNPDSGQFIESPAYTDEKRAARQSQRDNLELRLAEQGHLQAARLAEAQARHDADLKERTRNNDMRYSLGTTMAEIARMRAEAAATRTSDAAARQADAREAAAAKTRDQATQKYSAALEKAGIPEFHSALGGVEQTLQQYKAGELPGYGRFLGAVPNAALPTEHQIVRSNMATAANTLLKARSGAAVTDSELRRFLTEVGQGVGMDEATLRNGWANVRKFFDKKRYSIAAGFAPEVHESFLERGGEDHRNPALKYLPK